MKVFLDGLKSPACEEFFYLDVLCTRLASIAV